MRGTGKGNLGLSVPLSSVYLQNVADFTSGALQEKFTFYLLSKDCWCLKPAGAVAHPRQTWNCPPHVGFVKGCSIVKTLAGGCVGQILFDKM